MPHPALETILLVLFAVLLINSIFRFFRLPLILGYILVGVIVGPNILGLVPNSEVIQQLAEFGVVLLMFTIGLDFSFPKLKKMRFVVFVLGGGQVLVSILLTTLLGIILKLSVVESVVIGCIVSMSSTALVVKQLTEQGELNSTHGLTAMGILLFQDLAVIPVFILLGSLSAIEPQSFFLSLTLATFRGIFAVAVLFAIGYWVIKPLFRYINPTKSKELFTLIVLFIAIGSAWLIASLGMTLALGAFLSGVFLGETEYSEEIKDEIRPFRDLLLGIFFVSIGMLANLGLWVTSWVWILSILLALMVGKTVLIVFVCHLGHHRFYTSVRTGVILAQGGEFGFAILTLALNHRLLSSNLAQIVLAALLISFVCAPILIKKNQQIASCFAAKH